MTTLTSKKNTNGNDANQEVPIFLRKTYHMVDTCDPAICGWSDDGETFVVKDPVKFERTIIPQFFKHNKFSSFVRQLNFYSFRKIRYADTIRIDPKLEAETANYWRFRHDKFRRGHPELLSEIKRMNGQKSAGTNASVAANAKKPAELGCDNATSTEVLTLKKRIEEMTRDIDNLTAMVEKVSLKQEEQEKVADTEDNVPVGFKRQRTESCKPEDCTASEVRSNMDLGDVALPVLSMPSPAPLGDSPESVFSMPAPLPVDRETSDSTDSGFVEQMFSAFNDDADADDLFQLDTSLLPLEPVVGTDSNRPDPELMQRLSDALMLLPRNIQELLVDRLVSAILSKEGITSLPTVDTSRKDVVTSESKMSDAVRTASVVPQTEAETPETKKDVPLPFAAATLAALLHHYSSQVQGKAPKQNVKSIPVIPVHA